MKQLTDVHVIDGQGNNWWLVFVNENTKYWICTPTAEEAIAQVKKGRWHWLESVEKIREFYG